MEKNKMNIVRSFKALRGNAKACVWTEWMWAVPNTLYAAYATLYMQELGLSLAEIGLVSSLGLVVQIVASLLSGVIADKMGRRLTTFVFDMISWGIPVFLWSVAQSFEWFVAAAMCNGLWRITGVTFGLLSVEDAPQEELVHIFSLSELMSLFSAFFAPVSKVCVDIWGVVPTMRVIYAIACTLMVSSLLSSFSLRRRRRWALGACRRRRTQAPSRCCGIAGACSGICSRARKCC
ncbi:MAG: MFS transporter [Clostridia bacterium]|nr:MFS transporter [Clostridia bacterium]